MAAAFERPPFIYTDGLESISSLAGRDDILIDEHTPLMDRRLLCGLGLGAMVPLNEGGGFLGRAKKPKVAELYFCGHESEVAADLPTAVMARHSAGEEVELKEVLAAALKVRPDERRYAIANAMSLKELPKPKQLMRLIGNPPPGSPACASARVAPNPAIYTSGANAILAMAKKIAELPDAKEVGGGKATTATIGMLAAAGHSSSGCSRTQRICRGTDRPLRQR